MNLQDNELVNDELILFDVQAKDKEDLLYKLASLLYKKGYVKESYIDAVVNREKVYPTGLNTMGVQVAIPHTDAVHVNKPGIVVANLREPVVFKEMGSNDGQVNAELVFMLAIKNPKNQPKTLGKLMGIFSNGDKLNSIKKATHISEIKSLLRD
ncbi:PTS sugar transporter subunit IIA [Clostridiaceae bacterium M8S5]|nr:PTS sugar transporter subunit IIA [Clostridiaceae bacterium M8S5]